MNHPSLLPACGTDPLSDSPSLSCAMQLYTHHPSKLAVVQIRSGILPGRAPQFVRDILNWCKELHVSRVVTLTSSFAHERFVMLTLHIFDKLSQSLNLIA